MAKFALGRGLEAVLGDVEESYLKEVTSGKSSIREIELDSIVPNPYQPRKQFSEESIRELSESILKHGLLQPILVIKDINNYMIIAGERRYRASKMAGLTTIKAVVGDIKKDRIRELALIENIQRENLNPIELAISLKELLDEHKLTHEELSNQVKKSRSFITNTLRLLTLSMYVKDKLLDGKISQGHAKVLVGLCEADQKTVVDSITGQKLSVRETENMISKMKKDSINSIYMMKKVALHERLNFSKLTSLLEGKIGVKTQRSANKFTIFFEEQAEVDVVVRKLTKEIG